jgi:DNA-directed RNA polymerase subunit RPC12/RpoP
MTVATIKSLRKRNLMLPGSRKFSIRLFCGASHKLVSDFIFDGVYDPDENQDGDGQFQCQYCSSKKIIQVQ